MDVLSLNQRQYERTHTHAHIHWLHATRQMASSSSSSRIKSNSKGYFRYAVDEQRNQQNYTERATNTTTRWQTHMHNSEWTTYARTRVNQLWRFVLKLKWYSAYLRTLIFALALVSTNPPYDDKSDCMCSLFVSLDHCVRTTSIQTWHENTSRKRATLVCTHTDNLQQRLHRTLVPPCLCSFEMFSFCLCHTCVDRRCSRLVRIHATKPKSNTKIQQNNKIKTIQQHYGCEYFRIKSAVTLLVETIWKTEVY